VWLHDQINRISSIAAKYVGKPAGSLHAGSTASSRSSLSSHHLPVVDVLALHHSVAAGIDKPLVIELAVAAMEDLVRMAQLGEPHWVPVVVNDIVTEVMNEQEYARSFLKCVMPKSMEAMREAGDLVRAVLQSTTLTRYAQPPLRGLIAHLTTPVVEAVPCRRATFPCHDLF
jgi:homeobox-leucine zipper protein